MNCPHCKSIFRQHWLGRLAAEAFTSDYVRFVTLTYDEEHLDDRAFALDNEHFKDYSKSRRRKYDFKHFTVGEYGDKTGRPHWHSLQFFKGKPPVEPLDFAQVQYGWRKGNSLYQTPNSVAACCAYVYDYLDKGGKALRPSPGLGKQYLFAFARMQARNNRRLTDHVGIRYTVPNARRTDGVSWYYHIPPSHHWASDIAAEYVEEWERTQDGPLIDPLRNIDYLTSEIDETKIRCFQHGQ